MPLNSDPIGGISKAQLDAFSKLVSGLPGRVAFFAKDLESRLCAGNESLLHRVGKISENEILGRTDFELFPKALAEQFRRDDLRVFKSAKPLGGIVEAFFSTRGLPDWCVTDKAPLIDKDGRVVGLIGTSRRLETDEEVPMAAPGLSKAVSFLRVNFSRQISVDDIAEAAGISRRTLERLFSAHIGLTPSAFLSRTRVLAACEELRASRKPISDIALQLNFCDQLRRATTGNRRQGNRLTDQNVNFLTCLIRY